MCEDEAFLILSSIPSLGPVKLRALVQLCGSAVNALGASEDQLRELPGFEKVLPHWNSWGKRTSWKQELESLMRHQVALLPFTHPLFPKALLSTADCPALLYVRGAFKQLDQRCIAIVGTRRSSIYGNETAHQIARELSAHGFTIISGLARGIDTAAHVGALEGGRTAAVIGSGLANIYPAENQQLADSIAQCGALISEFPMETPPDRQNFPKRNRIVAGMAAGVLLIEAPVKSGAMLTMQKAREYQRPLFALPGRVDSENFKGNHALIKSGQAQLIEGAEDILAYFDVLFPMKPAKSVAAHLPLLDREEQSVFESLDGQECCLELLAMKLRLPIQQLHRILMSLVLKRVVKEFPGKIYKKMPQLGR
jgi:DNA processing protein